MTDDAETGPDRVAVPVMEEGGLDGCPQAAGGPADIKQQYDDLNDRFLRLAADFENYQKRSAREREALASLATERFAVDILEVLDNLERALGSDDAHLREGICHIQQIFEERLHHHGIIRIDAHNKQFNPAEHEAIAYVRSDEPQGTVVDVILNGYRLNDKVIRYAKVAVSGGDQTTPEA